MYENVDLFIFSEMATMDGGLKVSSPAKGYDPPLFFSHPRVSENGLDETVGYYS